MQAREMLKLCLQIETTVEKIYRDLSDIFPEASVLFDRLACEESRHADIVTITMKYLDLDLLPPEFNVDVLPLIRETLGHAAVLQRRIEDRSLTLSEALVLAASLEESGMEAYFQKVMNGSSGNDVLNYMKRFYHDCRLHADLIREFSGAHLKAPSGEGLTPPGSDRVNCWEYWNCGSEPGGRGAGSERPCPATTERRLDGVHGGVMAGRACWVVAGTLCTSGAQGPRAQSVGSCTECDFYRQVRLDSCRNFMTAAQLLEKLRATSS